MDRDNRRTKRQASSATDSEEGSPQWAGQHRARHRSNERDHAYNESKRARREQHRSWSPIDRRRDGRQRSRDPSQSPKRRSRETRNVYDESERRRRKHSSSPDHHRRDSRDNYRRSRKHNIKSRSSSLRRHPRSGENNRGSYHDHNSSRASASRRSHRDSRESHRQYARSKSKSHSPPKHQTRSLIARTSQFKRSHAPLPSQQDAFSGKSLSKSSKPDLQPQTDPPPEKEKPNYTPSGKLAAETNMVANTSVILKYNEPPQARLPPASSPWRLYIFKGDTLLETLPIHTRTCWLFGRERLVADCPIEHPSCSKQHAVIQFRHHEAKNEYGDKESRVRPYIIDLKSSNGTKVNGELVPETRYVELKDKDVITFGESTREYVLILPPKEGKKSPLHAQIPIDVS